MNENLHLDVHIFVTHFTIQFNGSEYATQLLVQALVTRHLDYCNAL